MKKSRKILKNVKTNSVYQRTLSTFRFLKIKKTSVSSFLVAQDGIDFVNDTCSVLFNLQPKTV
jgi:hypothetical protein